MQHLLLTFIDGLHAAAALNNRFVVVSNDETCDKLGIERLTFKRFLDLLKK